MGEPSPEDPAEVLAVFGELAGRIARIIAGGVDAEPGDRPDQYRFDLVADEVCREVLHGAGWALLSEESGVTGADGRELGDDEIPERLVIVDPVDGSTNASRGLRHSALAVALVERCDGRWIPVVALVADLDGGPVYSAVRGAGARVDGRDITVGSCDDLGRAIIGVNGLPDHDYGWSQFRALGSAALDICAVAAGALDGWVDTTDAGHGVWDYVAAMLIATEAGAVAADVEGRDLVVIDHSARRIPIVAATPELWADLLEHRRR